MKKQLLSILIVIIFLYGFCSFIPYPSDVMLFPSTVWYDAVNDANDMKIDYCWVLGDLIEGFNYGYYPNGVQGMWNDFYRDYNRINVSSFKGLVKGNHDKNHNFTSDYTYTIANTLFIISSNGDIPDVNVDNLNVFVLCHYPPDNAVEGVDFWLHGHSHGSPMAYKTGNMPTIRVSDITHKYGLGAESTFWYFYNNTDIIICKIFNHQDDIFTGKFIFRLKTPCTESFVIWFCSDVHIGGYKQISKFE